MSNRSNRSNGADRIALSRTPNSPRSAKSKTPLLNMDSPKSDILRDGSSSRINNRAVRSNTRSKRVSASKTSTPSRSRTPTRKSSSRSSPARATPNRSTPEVLPISMSPVRRASISRNSPPARSRSKRLSSGRISKSTVANNSPARKSKSPAKECKSCESNVGFSDNTVKEILTKYGYVEIEQAMMLHDNLPLCNFYFAINPRGTRTSIEVDIKTADKNNKGKCKMLKSQHSPSRIPISSKIGLFNSASPEVYGIVIACDNGICVMSRAENGLTVERSFSLGEEPVCGMQCVQPLVLLSDIISNPIDSVKLTETAASVLRKNMYAVAHKNLMELKKLNELLTSSIGSFISNENSKAVQLGEATYSLDKKLKNLDDHMKNETVKDIDLDNRKLLVTNMTWRKDLCDGLVSSMNSLGGVTADIMLNINKLNILNDDVNNKFEGFEYIKKL